MALFDDRRFLLSHINHSFITGDDTGICEVVMLDEDVFENQHQQCLKLDGQNDKNLDNTLKPEAYDLDYESELFDSEQGQSYDIADDLDYICHRRRSNTAQRLDRLKKEKINQSRTKTIVWRCNSPTNSQSEDRLSQESPTSSEPPVSENIIKPENGITVETRKSKSPPEKSGLTRLLEKFPSLPKNPFDEFAKFDGGMSETVPVLKIMIFIALNNLQPTTNEIRLDNNNEINYKPNNSAAQYASGSKDLTPISETTLADKSLQFKPPKNNGPLEVVIVSTARVIDLIGLICWQYTNEGREPKLHHDIYRYCLRIAEDNGEVDPDFASLNVNEPLSKFNFPSLALTERTEEKVKRFSDRYANGNIYNHRVPSMPQNVITSSSAKISNASSRFDALRRIIFKDAKLDTNQ